MGLLPIGLGRRQPTDRFLECMSNDHRSCIVRIVAISDK